MGCLIVTIIAGILGYFDLISDTMFMIAVFGSLAWVYIGAALYFACGFLKFFYHDFLHWHRPDDSPEWSDGCSVHCVCKYCQKEIMQDSQGNWFTFE
jgi:hypothetical protein